MIILYIKQVCTQQMQMNYNTVLTIDFNDNEKTYIVNKYVYIWILLTDLMPKQE